ncbi:hypothetical protein [Microlunatus speluncae]|uniref:hypothetical protein n=1 Tax=Microlunatus speluncae TaxID=2594267 RepID=UPI0012661FB7|nr:hypothetical protein [Microlunatus speluncae]
MSSIRAGRFDRDVAVCVELWVEAVTARDGAVPDPAALVARMRGKFEQPTVRFAVIDADPAPGGTQRPVAGFALTVVRPDPLPDRTGTAPAFLDLLAVAPAQAGRGLGRARPPAAAQTRQFHSNAAV